MKVIGIIGPMRERGMTLQAIAEELTNMGVGANWSPSKVKRTLDRMENNHPIE